LTLQIIAKLLPINPSLEKIPDDILGQLWVFFQAPA